MTPQNDTKQRKAEHVQIVLNENVSGQGITTGFEKYRLVHEALPDIDFDSISLNTRFLSRNIATPFLISSMTGGTQATGDINRVLATAAQERGWTLALGSMRVAIENPETHSTFQMRPYAPDIPILVNLGAVQLNKGMGVEHCRQIVEIAEADGLILHLNSMQEAFQPDGDTNFSGLLKKIEKICTGLNTPVGVKEVGWGIHGTLARKLYDCGVHFIDVAGAGGTSWSQVESFRSTPMLKKAAKAFLDWGIPTAECIHDIREKNPSETLIASGGLQNGVDAAKSIALGANLAGFGRFLLRDAVNDPTKLVEKMSQVELELKLAMFGVGANTIDSLSQKMIHKIS
ncbi:type 2 isopentenyl-diphosphate Delta-isomerase [Shimazuella sp. AN120528]|uniref:type 2 isopentenyl-diphosphate Delta-isomerase n=1 Tax=Shimazuella soli TaxID=1892854 RepID=UPI001F0CF654|nr:type 2 isopentenyl-diphosphate Delta-isomerase [Shimazuella soli]MCH5584526.1 type 2 isopentenyl-diphosphate Delta-isomerase [Shimazuella soli]